MGFSKQKILKLAKGFRGRAKNVVGIARLRVEKALQYAYISRKLLKRDMRSLWVTKINAATREHGVKYSVFMDTLQQENIQINRKMLAELAMTEPYSFKALAEQVKFMRALPNGNREPGTAKAS